MAHANSEQPTVVGLVPAAGASRRMGRDKRLIPLGDRTVLETTVASLREGGVTQVVVVLEPDSPCLELASLEEAIVAVNPEPELGMLSSIRVGLGRIPTSAGAAAVLPGDHPFVPPAAIAALLAHYLEHQPLLLVPRYADGRGGHPLFIGRRLFAEAASCDDAVGLRQLLQRRAADVRTLALELSGAERDLDTPDDLSSI